METRVLNYRILIEQEEMPRTKKAVHVAYCPKLGVSDWGTTIDEALNHIREAIECHIESLVKHHESVPESDDETYVVATTSVSVPRSATVAYPHAYA